jgi:hypothetical protein
MHQDFGVGGGLEDRSVFFELLTKSLCVNKVSIVSDGKAFSLSLNEKGLDTAQVAGTCGGIPHMTNSSVAGQLMNAISPSKDIGYQALATVRVH